MATKFPSFNQGLAQDPTTRRIWYGIATAHDFESHDGMTEEKLYQKLFSTHFGHLAIIALWVAGTYFILLGRATLSSLYLIQLTFVLLLMLFGIHILDLVSQKQ